MAGAGKVDAKPPPLMGGEDFSFMLEARPGAFIFIGNGDTAGVHHPSTTSTTRHPRRHLLLGPPGRDGHAGVMRLPPSPCVRGRGPGEGRRAELLRLDWRLE